MGFLGNLLSNAVNQTVNRTVSNVVSDATSKASDVLTNKIKETAKSTINNSKSKMREKILEGAKAYRDNPIGKINKDSNVVLFASDREIKYKLNNISYKVDVVGCVTWQGKEYNFAESNPVFYANLAYECLQTELDNLSSQNIEPNKISSHMLDIINGVNTGKLSEKTKETYGHSVMLSIMLLELPDISSTDDYSSSVSTNSISHICPYCGTTYEGNVCTFCGANLED